MSARTPDVEPLLTPAQVGHRLGVDPKTVARWAKAGVLPSFRLPGGHRRFRQADVDALLSGEAACVKCGHPLKSDEHLAQCVGTGLRP